FRPNLSDYEASRYGQRELQLEFFTGDTVNLSDKADGQYVLASCFGGRRVTDTVLEIATQLHNERPDVTIYWGVVDESVSVPVERSEEHTSELQSRFDLVCRLLLEKKKMNERSSSQL